MPFKKQDPLLSFQFFILLLHDETFQPHEIFSDHKGPALGVPPYLEIQ